MKECLICFFATLAVGLGIVFGWWKYLDYVERGESVWQR